MTLATDLALRAAAYDADRIIRADGTKHGLRLAQEKPLAARLVPFLKPHLQTECRAVAYDKAILQFKASLS